MQGHWQGQQLTQAPPHVRRQKGDYCKLHVKRVRTGVRIDADERYVLYHLVYHSLFVARYICQCH